MIEEREVSEWAKQISSGDRLAIARALRLIEDTRAEAEEDARALLGSLYPLPSPAHRIGITGPPGVGKSTLIGSLSRAFVARGFRVGVLAVDPSSVRSGGALLGDRARMNHTPSASNKDWKLFVRSLPTAGASGGLSGASFGALRVLGAACDIVLLETTGVGQNEIDIQHAVDTVTLLIQPGSGDSLQFIKAGVMEIPDLLVVHKADLESAERTFSDAKAALSLKASTLGEESLVTLQVSARTGEGVDALIEALVQRFKGLDLRSRREKADSTWAFELLRGELGREAIRKLGGERSVLDRLTEKARQSVPPLEMVWDLRKELQA